jgi:hypothetical protein
MAWLHYERGNTLMQGKRVDWQPNADDWQFPALKPGEYGKDEDGVWYCVPPGSIHGVLGCLGNGVGNKGHKVVERENGTITVSPSILIRGEGEEYHGYLEQGVWRKC